MESSCTAAKSSQIAATTFINEQLSGLGLYGDPKKETHANQNSSWRISPEPFYLSKSEFTFFSQLGTHLLEFYRATQRLYELSLQGRQPDWIREYLEMGKPELVKEYGKIRRSRQDFPLIIRPDILLTEDGIKITELDSIPGGFGLTGALSEAYSELGYSLIGGPAGIVESLKRAFHSMVEHDNPTVAIVVSQESQDYRQEMEWISSSLRLTGLNCFSVSPREIIFQEDGLYLEYDGSLVKLDLVYRFFELFDLKNIPKMDLFLYAFRKRTSLVTPPLKHFLEEKMLFALFAHPTLEAFWQDQLGEEGYRLLASVFPESWVMDARKLPPHAVIPNLAIDGKAVTDWRELKDTTKKQRELVIKISGFSEMAWGSKGVYIGHDMAKNDWESVIDQSLESFPTNPFVLQKFYKGRKVTTSYYDFGQDRIRTMQGRVRLCPYYIFTGEGVELSGILATVCPLDKKLIHGMVDAIMVPCAVED